MRSTCRRSRQSPLRSLTNRSTDLLRRSSGGLAWGQTRNLVLGRIPHAARFTVCRSGFTGTGTVELYRNHSHWRSTKDESSRDGTAIGETPRSPWRRHHRGFAGAIPCPGTTSVGRIARFVALATGFPASLLAHLRPGIAVVLSRHFIASQRFFLDAKALATSAAERVLNTSSLVSHPRRATSTP